MTEKIVGDAERGAVRPAGRAGRIHGERNWGIDLLRIVCMLLVCMLHVCGQGGAMARVSGHEETWRCVYLLEVAAYCAVDTYGLISGYVGLDAQHRPSRLLELWLTVFWYSALGSLAGVFFFHLPAEEGTLYKALFPTLWSTYWYFSAYVGVFLFSPYLNRMVKALSGKEKRRLIWLLIAVCSVLTMIPRVAKTGGDFLKLGAGYSFSWLVILYVIGACIRDLTRVRPPKSVAPSEKGQVRRDFLHRSTRFYGMLYLVLVILTWYFKFPLEAWTRRRFGEVRYGFLFLSYMGPTVLVCAICLLMIFSRLKIRGKWIRQGIHFLAPMAFSVYLVQVQPYFWTYVLREAFAFIARREPGDAVLLVFLWTLLLYLGCTAVDLIRAGVFRILRIRAFCDKLINLGSAVLTKIGW